MNLVISKYCIISEGAVKINGEKIYSQEKVNDIPGFLKNTFKQTGNAYMKFYKMDNLSKLAFLASELLLKDTDILLKYKGNDIAVILQNGTSTIDIDTKYWNTVNDKNNYFPNPSLFVFTLPNIMLSEICIKNKITGENALFVFEKFNPEFFEQYINILFETGKARCCIGGWVDYNESDYSAFLMSIEEEKNAKGYFCRFNSEKIMEIF
ncbi:MAG: 3-oxoacyl-ACP synthase [Bacteroidia bacterium]|nr:3-oxoacyl-ACP synthase [Bacteroidia bacterium]